MTGQLPLQSIFLHKVQLQVCEILEFLSFLIRWDLCTLEVPACEDQAPLKHRREIFTGLDAFFKVCSTPKKLKKDI